MLKSECLLVIIFGISAIYFRKSMLKSFLHRLQIDFAYKLNYIEDSRLPMDKARMIFETNILVATGHKLVSLT